ncbi:MerR family transcriptional regulator [Nonomuraea sp. NPDC003214]
MAGLSAATGVPVPTIKYYLREGLLPPGRPLARNQAEYGPAHVRRLKLVRALADYGGLSIAAIAGLVRHLDDPGVSAGELLAEAQPAVAAPEEPGPAPGSGAAAERARDRVAALLARKGWDRLADHPSAATLTGVLASLLELGLDDVLDGLDDYAEAAEAAASADVRILGDVTDRERAVEVVALGTLLGDTLIAALRRLAQARLAEATYES